VVLLPVIALAVSPLITNHFVHLKPHESVDRLLYWNLAVTAAVWIALYLLVQWVLTFWRMKREWMVWENTNELNIYVCCGPQEILKVHRIRCELRHVETGESALLEEQILGGVLGPASVGGNYAGFNYPPIDESGQRPLPTVGEYEADWKFCEREEGTWYDAKKYVFSYER